MVKGQPELARFQFRARNRWQSGTLSETTITSFSGAGGEHEHKTTFKLTADHPAVLVGDDRAPLPIEFLLHALATCITGGIANRIADRLRSPLFKGRFIAKGRYRERMERVTVRLATIEEPGLLGAAVAFQREWFS